MKIGIESSSHPIIQSSSRYLLLDDPSVFHVSVSDEITWLLMPNPLSNLFPVSVWPLILDGWRVPPSPISAHVCGVEEGKCLRRGVRQGFLADPAVLSNPHCLPALSQQAHPAAAGTIQPGPPLVPISPSSGEVEFNPFFPDGSSQTSTRDPDPPQPEPRTSTEPFSPSSQISPS